MIKANELRIGNLIKDASGQIHSVTAGTIMYLRDAEESDYNNCNPIPLTDEILLKVGWVWNNECNSYEKYPDGDTRVNITKESNLSGRRHVFNYVLSAKIAEVTYLHQLQNLYFALTGKELNTAGLI